MSVIAPPRRLLFGPGPSQVEPRVYEALSQPIVGHLDPYFFKVSEQIRTGLQAVYGTQNAFTMAISGTGSAGMEAAVSNFVEAGSKFVVFTAGYFGDRIANMGGRHRAEVVRCEKPWGDVFTEDEARAVIQKEKPAAVAFVHAETSSGTLQDPVAITRPAHEVGAITIADCVTSLGTMPVNVDANGIDVAYSCTQKGMSCPPGLSPLTISPRAAEKLKARPIENPVWYLDLKMLLDYFEQSHRYHHTAPISSFWALAEGLAAVMDEGVEKRFERHARCHTEFVKRMEALGLQMHVPAGHRIPTLNTVRVPEGLDELRLRRQLVEEYGIEIAGGLGMLAGKIFRIGVMGPLATEENLDLFFKAFEKCLTAAAVTK